MKLNHGLVWLAATIAGASGGVLAGRAIAVAVL
jgi:hypothetical protein